jgi:oxygen-independent coproporphyrinogen-3 oxidase
MPRGSGFQEFHIMSVLSPSAGACPPVEFDAALIGKMSLQGPRYTSYPTADRFTESFDYGDYLEAVAGVRARNVVSPLSLYVHIPFCDTVCYYCACNKIVTRDHDKAATYLGYLKREIAMQGQQFVGINGVTQLHLGGGTPTYLSEEQMDELMSHLRRWFRFAPDAEGEYSIEVDPRSVDKARIQGLRLQGFNRISLGVQDFDPMVQKAVNRIQPEAQTRAIIDAARETGFRSVNMDLIYGLPLQSAVTMDSTLDKVIAAAPDRISVYNYAHLPHLFKPQRRIAESDLPSADEKLRMLSLCIDKLTDAGYVYIGMDHFARPDDELAIAQRQGRLHRNFQGYSTHADTDLVSCGVSAISAVGLTYSQNVKTLDAYYSMLDCHRLPIARGIKLNLDDVLRRSIIQMLMCNFELSISALQQAYPIDFNHYFSTEMEQLEAMQEDGLLSIDEDWITVSPKGRLLVRNICMVFDRYLQQRRAEPLRYSRTI